VSAPEAPATWHIVAKWDEAAWVVQALEYDICAQGKTLSTALANLGHTIEAEAAFTHHKHGRYFANIDPTPEAVIQDFEDATRKARGDQ
jgi:hypothetical protein